MGTEITLDSLIGTSDMTVIDALRKIDLNARGILFITNDKGQLTGCLTDGDVRRWLIHTGKLATTVKAMMNRAPKSMKGKAKQEALSIMSEFKIRAIPVVDEDNHLVDVIFSDKNNGQITMDTTKSLEETPVVIMAGGSGTRLYPYTKILPKPLIPIGDLPIAERIINQFRMFGCRKYYLIVNVKKGMIKAYFNEIDKEYDIFYADEDIPLGTGGGLSLLRGKIDTTFILSNCDILIRDDFSKMMQAHKDNGNIITMVCSLKSYPIPYGVVHLDSRGSLESIDEKPNLSFMTNTGCYIVNPEVLDEITPGIAVGFPDVMDRIQKKGGRVGIYPVSEQAWLDMGQMDSLEEMRERIEKEAVI